MDKKALQVPGMLGLLMGYCRMALTLVERCLMGYVGA